ncbi:acyltransferase family protein [Niallia oryzisoli]|uniref:Acyltransferase family protein n=1 Tax=Niallia oryzisoli TaxID=1737571 RepID=A0ABZ2CAX4_9BACI
MYIACVGIVLMHALSSSLMFFDNTSNLFEFFADFIRLSLMFGTPAFIFISEFVIAYSYPRNTPKGFILKRMRYIFIPYVCIGILYTWLDTMSYDINFKGFLVEVFLKIVLGSFHGYFILVIFQFYLLHMFFIKKIVNKFNPNIVIITSIIVNILYLGFFNFIVPEIKPFLNNFISDFYLGKLNILPFFAWVGYFTVAYYCGSRYLEFLSFVKCFSKKYIALFFILSLSTLQFLYHVKLLEVMSSKRIDVFFYTFSVILCLFYLATKIRKTPKVIEIISQYSFGIYLLHPFFQKITEQVLNLYTPEINITSFTIILFVVGIGLSMITTLIFNQFKIGKYIVGQVGRGISNDRNVMSSKNFSIQK